MREIKFRFWDGKKMIYNGYSEADCYFHGLLVCEGDTIPLQYTGLKDKNGVEIYEGDVMKDETTYPLEVVWLRAGWGFRWFDTQGEHTKEETELLDQDWLNNYGEVIGNIFLNPELLQKLKEQIKSK